MIFIEYLNTALLRIMNRSSELLLTGVLQKRNFRCVPEGIPQGAFTCVEVLKPLMRRNSPETS